MDIVKLLDVAGVPSSQKKAALNCLLEAHRRTDGLLLHKIKTRYLLADDLAKKLAWEDERLIDVNKSLAPYDIEPMRNITCNGDNAPWEMTAQGGRPREGHWLNKDPQSADYREAVASCYWCPGHHPRSYEARKTWYRRNGGAYRAYQLGMEIDPSQSVEAVQGVSGKLWVSVYRCGDVWQLNATQKVAGRLTIKTRIGYEITNVWNAQGELAWYPIVGHTLKAPVTWSVLPSLKG